MRRRIFLSEAVNYIRGSAGSDPSAETTASEMSDNLQRILSVQISEQPAGDHENMVSIFKSALFAEILDQAK